MLAENEKANDLAPKALRILGLQPKARGATTAYWRSQDDVVPGVRWWAFHRKTQNQIEFGVKVFAGGDKYYATLQKEFLERPGKTFYESISADGQTTETVRRLQNVQARLKLLLATP